MNSIIEIRDLRKKFKKTMAVDGLNLVVPEGAVTAFLGPNGAGKTTTIKCLLNIHKPDSGDVNVLGVDSRRASVPRRFGSWVTFRKTRNSHCR